MDDSRFDDLSRAIASRHTTPNRRSVLGALGGAMAALGLGRAAAQGSGNGNGNGNGNTGWGNGNNNGNGNRGRGNGNGNGNGGRGWGNGNGNGNHNGWCDPSLTCAGSGYVDEATCTCACDLTVSDCPGGVNAESCSCIPIFCEAKQADCGDPSLTCSCGAMLGSGELVCIDRTGPNGYTCNPSSGYECADGMVCADDDGCGDYFCYPQCGQAAAFAMLPNRLV